MESLGLEATNATVYKMVTDLSRDGDDLIDFLEFLNMIPSNRNYVYTTGY